MSLLNEEDFNTSESWLSEQLFAQLRDFNDQNSMELMNIYQNFPTSMPLLEEELPPEDFRKTRLDSFETAFEINKPKINFNVKSEVLDLSNVSIKKQPMDIIDPSQNLGIDLTKIIHEIPAPTIAQSAAVTSESIKQSENPKLYPFGEELKILKYLSIEPKQEFFESKILQTPELPSTAYRIVKCANCNYLFDIITFQSHVCDYDEDHNLILPLESIPASIISKPIKEESLLPPEPACIRLLKENQIRIRRFLKDELKYDVNAAGNQNSLNTNTTHDSSTSSISNGVLNSTASTISSSSTNKKQDGPHECSLCERKFVHASGLLRHMEKHAMDLIPTSSNSTTGNKSMGLSQGSSLRNSLRVVIKCTFCGRIFFEPNAGLEHLSLHFPNKLTDEQEMDNTAEIPYDAYVDDAVNYLKFEAQGSYNNDNIFNCQEDKTPIYLKMVILSCVLQCEFCDLIFSEVSYLLVHSACHLPERRFECFACNINVKTSKEICTHWQAECVFMRENLKVHQAAIQRYFVCNVCENKFQSIDQLHEHRYTSYHFFPRLNQFLDILQLPCEYCESVFDNAHECVAHYEEKHYKKYNKKDKDGSGSSSKTRQYLCDVCGKSYTQSSHLWQHLRFHQGVKPFACKEPGCTRKFTIRPDLNDHIRKCHTGERPYHCLICGKRFLTGSVFYQHRLIHRGERRYECEDCGKRFYRADALKNHQRIHTGEKPFGCLFCTKNFRQRGDRDKHMRARHSHLDANARLRMQMQKIQLEAAAAGAPQVSQPTANNVITPMDTMFINNENTPPSTSTSNNTISSNDIVMIGNVAFPRSVINSLIPDMVDKKYMEQ